MKQRNRRDFFSMKSFLLPYAWQPGLMILIGLAGSGLGLVQSYPSKYYLDSVFL